MTKVAIVGAGAIGCLLTARLSATDAEVTLVARPASAKVIGRDGITMTTPGGRDHSHRRQCHRRCQLCRPAGHCPAVREGPRPYRCA